MIPGHSFGACLVWFSWAIWFDWTILVWFDCSFSFCCRCEAWLDWWVVRNGHRVRVHGHSYGFFSSMARDSTFRSDSSVSFVSGEF